MGGKAGMIEADEITAAYLENAFLIINLIHTGNPTKVQNISGSENMMFPNSNHR